MGLDMFLLRINDDGGSKELFYWRKAYPIMDWFENHFNGIDNSEDYPVCKDDLCSLREFCGKVLEDNHFHEMDDFEVIEWTSEMELSEWGDFHMDYIRSTKSFLDGFLKDNNEWDGIIFKAWW